MRKFQRNLFVLIFLTCGAFVSTALADGIEYTISGVFSSSTSTTPSTAPNTPFTITFSVPSSLTGSYPPALLVNLDYTLGSEPVFAADGLVTFLNAADGGGFDVLFAHGPEVDFALKGPQLFNGSTSDTSSPFVLKTGSFAFDTSKSFVEEFGGTVGTFDKATVNATSAGMPEPSSLLLLAAGLVGLPLMRRAKRR